MRQDVTNQVQQPIREAVTESKLSIPSASQVFGIMNSELKLLIDNLNKLLSEPLIIVFKCKFCFNILSLTNPVDKEQAPVKWSPLSPA